MTQTTSDLQQKYLNTVEALKKASAAYYAGSPIMPDSQFDSLVDKVRQIEHSYPEWTHPESPTQVVGAPVSPSAVVTRHPVPMLSLLKATTKEEISSWVSTLPEGIFISCAPKLDGISMSLEYEGGELIRAVTRGDGEVGEDVTAKILHMDSVPREAGYSFTGIIRGEIVIHTADLSKNYKNARNAAAGVMGASDHTKAAKEGARFYAFDIISSQGNTSISPGRLGFNSVPIETIHTSGSNLTEIVWSALQRANEARETAPYLTDGVVLKVINTEAREEMGNRSNSPRWAIAFKTATDTAVARLIDVVFQTAKTGTLGIVGILDGVELEGTFIQRVTLHNMSEIRRLDIRKGDLVTIKRAGSVIPAVVGPVVESRTGEEEIIHPPTECPSCAGPVQEYGNSGQIRCTSDDCTGKLVRQLTHWCSRKGLDVDSVSGTWLEAFIEAGLVSTFADLYRITRLNLMQFPNMGDGRATKFLDSIEKSKQAGMRRVLTGLSIPNCGSTISKDLCREFESVEEVANASLSQLVAIDSIGLVVGSAIHEFFQKQGTKDLLAELREVGVNMARLTEDAPLQVAEGVGGFKDEVVVITGKLPYPREEIARMIEAAGGKVTGSVSKKSTLLLAGENVGATKTNKAREVGTRVIFWDEAAELLGLDT